jgi:hypothetical protein
MQLGFIVAAGFAGLAVFLWGRRRRLARAEYIRRYSFPKGLMDKLHKVRPELAAKDQQLVARALRQYFLAYLRSGRKPLSMPSQVVDDLWHEFILYTRHYQLFCRKAFGGFLHHTPAVVLGRHRRQNAGLRRAWWFSCLEENINPRRASRLPLLFAIDAKLNIPNGFRYALDCSRQNDDRDGATPFCAGDFDSDRFDGTTEGFGDDSWFGSGDSDGGIGGSDGCAGDGCSGGGCGGD